MHSPAPRPAAVPSRNAWSAIETAFLGTPGLALGGPLRWEPEPLDASCPRCGRTVAPGEVSPDDRRCPMCRVERLRWEWSVRLGEYEDPLRRAIIDTKYTRWRAQGTLLGRMLAPRVALRLESLGVALSDAIAVPVPMPWDRRFRRGIDHALTIARAMASSADIRLCQPLRRRGGRPQVEVAPSARAANIRGRIHLARRLPAGTRAIVLVDDVRTTGATADACCRALRQGLSAEVHLPIVLATVAVAREPTRRLRSPGSGDAAGSLGPGSGDSCAERRENCRLA
ncbi:MAG: ComF family protein [Phycisphaerales bacterium]